MDKLEKIVFPDFVVEILSPFIETISTEGQFFDDPKEFSDQESVDIGRIYLWNILGQEVLNKYLVDPEDIYFSTEDVEKLLVSVVIQTNLHLLMKDKLVDGIENEHGEMVYWLTEKGRKITDSFQGQP